MQVKSNKASATLTDVKNKTGDVFGLADKHGSVLITSYNKPKYVISKYQPDTTESPAKGVEEVPAVAQEDKLAPITQPEVEKKKQVPSQEISPTKELPPQPDNTTEVHNVAESQEEKLPKMESIQPVESLQPPTSGSAAFTISAKDSNRSQPTPQEPEPVDNKEKKSIEPAKPSPLGGLLGIFSHGDSWNRNNNRELNWSKKAKELLG